MLLTVIVIYQAYFPEHFEVNFHYKALINYVRSSTNAIKH